MLSTLKRPPREGLGGAGSVSDAGSSWSEDPAARRSRRVSAGESSPRNPPVVVLEDLTLVPPALREPSREGWRGGGSDSDAGCC